MTIDEAIKVAEGVEDGRLMDFCATFNPETVLALLRFVQAWDACQRIDGIDMRAAHKARAAVDEALK